MPLPMKARADFNAGKQAEFIRELHEKTREKLQQKGEYNAAKANQGRRRVIFKLGDLVWVHLRKERFPDKCKSKLSPRGDGPFKVLKRVGDNAYVLELPGEYGVSATFNVGDFTLYEGLDEELEDSRWIPFQDREDDKGSPTPQVPAFEGPITRARGKKIQRELDKVIPFFLSKEPFMLAAFFEPSINDLPIKSMVTIAAYEDPMK